MSGILKISVLRPQKSGKVNAGPAVGVRTPPESIRASEKTYSKEKKTHQTIKPRVSQENFNRALSWQNTRDLLAHRGSGEPRLGSVMWA